MSLKTLVERADTPSGRIFDLSIQVLILISLASFCVETLPHLSPGLRDALGTLEAVVVAIFTAEYLVRFAVADHKLKYLVSFYGLVDLLAILPFYVARGIDLRVVRMVRLFRILRVLKVVRYTRALDRFRRALATAKEELLLFLVATALFMFLASVGVYYCEHDAQPEAFSSVFDAMWWSVVTFTTVGYGDVYPVTVGGKLLTFVMLILGLGVVAVPPAIMASALTEVRKAPEEEPDDSSA